MVELADVRATQRTSHVVKRVWRAVVGKMRIIAPGGEAGNRSGAERLATVYDLQSQAGFAGTVAVAVYTVRICF